MTTGANTDDRHVRGVDIDRDIPVTEWLDVREVAAEEACPDCGAPLAIERTIEVGHIFKLGRTYTDAFGVSVLGPDGGEITPIMGSYGIGVERNLAVAVEVHHDDKGIVWPIELAPWAVVITVVRPDDPDTAQVAEDLYGRLVAAGVDAIIDDRDERPGVKFADAELVGIPIRVTVGPRGVADGVVEVTERRSGARHDPAIEDAADTVLRLVGG